jgi:hypothetical protein
MRGDNDDVGAIRPRHNPQDPAAELGDCLVAAEAIQVARVNLDEIRRANRVLDPDGGDVSLCDRFLCVLGKADHASTTTRNSTTTPWRAGDLGVQRFFECTLLVRPHQPRIPRHIDGRDRGGAAALAHEASPAARRRPERNSSPCSGWRNGFAVGATTGVRAASRLRINRASSSRPIWA